MTDTADQALPISDDEIVPIGLRLSEPRWDRRDYEFVRASLDARRTLDGPQVGDWLQFVDGTTRIAYVWDDGAQPADGIGSIHLFRLGTSSYSGSLRRSVPLAELTRTDETRPSRMWIFHHGWPGAHRGVHFTIPTTVWAVNRHMPH